jgi:hypothetical protein
MKLFEFFQVGGHGREYDMVYEHEIMPLNSDFAPPCRRDYPPYLGTRALIEERVRSARTLGRLEPED